MIGLILLVLAELADVITSVVGMASGRTVEANPLLPHDLVGLVAIKVLLCLMVTLTYVGGDLLPWPKQWRSFLDTGYTFVAGAVLTVALYNLGLVSLL